MEYFQKGYSLATLRRTQEFEDSNIKEVLAIVRGLIAAGFLERVRGRGAGIVYLISQDGMKIFDILKQV